MNQSSAIENDHACRMRVGASSEVAGLVIALPGSEVKKEDEV